MDLHALIYQLIFINSCAIPVLVLRVQSRQFGFGRDFKVLRLGNSISFVLVHDEFICNNEYLI